MTPARFLVCLAHLRWTASGVAVWCGYARQSGTWWATGRVAVPEPVGAWLEARMAGRLDDPPGR